MPVSWRRDCLGSGAFSLPKPGWKRSNPQESALALGIVQTLTQSRKCALSDSIRRESLYPAELSGWDLQIVELTARSIEVL